MKRYFTVKSGDRAYAVIGNEHTTLETVWASQKCFFLPGTEVIITDDHGNSRKFIK